MRIELQTMIDKEVEVSSLEERAALEVQVVSLLGDPEGGLSKEDRQNEDFIDEQNLIARSIHLIRAKGRDLDLQFRVGPFQPCKHIALNI